MKIIIDHCGVKRQIDGPFLILGNGDDLRRLAREIERHVSDDPGFYGWIEIHQSIRMSANTPPRGWAE